MATDVQMTEPSESVFVQGGTSSSGLEYQVHPLVLLNISDHCTRMRYITDEPYPRVIGCLLGQHTGRCVDISNSFEMLQTGTSEDPDFDRSIFEQKREQYSECFASLDVLGWYSTRGPLQATDLVMHKKFMDITEAPIYLIMDARAVCEVGAKELPVSLYECAVTMVDSALQTRFVAAVYNMATSDAERIGVQAAADVLPTGEGDTSAVGQHYNGLHSALKMFAERVTVILEHLNAMQAGTRPIDYQILRMAAGLLDKMPATFSAEFCKELVTESTDASVVNLLCQMTKRVDSCMSLMEWTNTAYSHRRS